MILRLKPDRLITNANVDSFASSLHDLNRSFYSRIRREGKRIIREPQTCIVWEWHLSPGDAIPLLRVPDRDVSAVRQYAQVCWPRVTIDDTFPDPLSEWSLSHVLGANASLKEHYLYSLSIDRRSHAPLPALLETLRLLQEGERALVQVCMVPAPIDWHTGAQEAYERLRTGYRPKRAQFSGRTFAEGGAKFAVAVALHINALVAEIITSDEIEPDPVDPPRQLTGDQMPTNATMQKGKYPAFEVSIRLAASSPDPGRRGVILRALGTSFRDLDGDNAIVYKRVENMKGWWDSVAQGKPPIAKLNHDYLSSPEVGRLMQLPIAALQDEYELTAIDNRESDLPDVILQGGIEFGTHTFRGKQEPVYIPTKNWDELCLPRVVIGQMGSGKTRGFGGNFGVGALAEGFTVFTIDAAKDELGDEIEHGAKNLGIPRDHIHRLKFGEEAYRLDWRESTGKRSSNRLASEAVNFFRLHGAEAGVETARYIRLAGKTIGELGGTLADMVDLFLDDSFRENAVKRLAREDLIRDWTQFDKLSPGMKGKVLDPVLNRIDMLLGDDYLAECLRCTNGINFNDWITGGHLVSMHIPKRDLGAEATDILVDFMMSKIELAMFARPESEQKPCFVICDEPHVFPSCAPRWERMAVESRKWRLGLVWMFHSFEQIPRTLANRMKDAGVHYHVYTSSKLTYRNLAEEIAPFTVEEAMRTPRHHAINAMFAGGRRVTPFMAKMSPPPMAH